MDHKEILKRKKFVSTAKSSLFWTAINLSSVIFLLLELNFSIFSSLFYLNFLQKIVIYFEFLLVILFIVNSVYNFQIFIRFKKFMHPIELTSDEFQLFEINPKEVGFKLKEKSINLDSNKSKLIYPSTPPFDMSSNSLLYKHPTDSTSSSLRFVDHSNDTISSWSFHHFSSDKKEKSFDSFTSPLNRSFDNRINNESKFHKSHAYLRKLNQKSVVSSEEDLERYLLQHEERQNEINELMQFQKRFSPVLGNLSSPPVSPMMNNLNFSAGSHSSFSLLTEASNNLSSSNFLLNSRNSSLEQSDTSKISPESSAKASLSYKPAIKVVALPKSLEKSESINSSPKTVEKILSRLDINDSRLNQMVENIRKWISQTILVRLVEEIEAINKIINEKGYIDSMIGETSLKQLKHLAETKKNEFPTLEQVCCFLDLNIRNIENNIPFQQYFVRRIRDLSKGGCMIEFMWHGGGNYDYKPWKEDMITDSEIIMHVFCVYMDSRLLFNPTVPEGKPFTSQYFKTYQGKIPKSDTYIQQNKLNPPLYELFVKGEQFELPSGRNNLFYALLVFLWHIKTKNFGLLGRINLGPSGLNISWVIDK